jgi:K(+)-stimulated pyrophosphate-energized sodium pump
MDILTENSTTAAVLAVVISLLGLGFVWYQGTWVLKQDSGSGKMTQIANAIQRGAQAFLSREYRAIGIFATIIAVLLVVLSQIEGTGMSIWAAVAFVAGAITSGLAGYVGMFIAVRANVRTTQAASNSLNQGLRVAFASGTVMGTAVVSLALLGVGVMFILIFNQIADPNAAASALAGFGFGTTSIAIFARVGGGIFTKAADVGADLVGKTEAGIPEDDPRNPATIADNVGDNVGDVAGMGSDLFESYSSAIIAAIALATMVGGGVVGSNEEIGNKLSVAAQVFPLLVSALGILVGIGATYLVQTKEDATEKDLLWSLRKGTYSASAIVGVIIVVLANVLGLGTGAVIATLSGLIGGVLIGYFTEYFTAATYGPTRQLAQSAEGGAGIVIIRGLALGMLSTVPLVIIVIGISLISVASMGLYGVAISAVGMLSTLGITLAADAYGPVADNAGGIAEMAGLDKSVRERTDALDSLGNTTAATGKGFAIGSAAMTALALIAAFVTAVQGDTITPTTFSEVTTDVRFVIGLFIGGVLPFVFSALTMVAVGNAAQEIVVEVRRQFKEIPGLMEGTAEPDYETCVAISTDTAIKQMIAPGLVGAALPIILAILTIVGQGNELSNYVGSYTLVGMLLGSLVSAFMLAIMMANAGGAWDNAKKYIEAGNYGGKGSPAHKAAVVGDTVGDPFKDTSGPSLNTFLKMLAIVALVLAPMIASYSDDVVVAPDVVNEVVIQEPEAESSEVEVAGDAEETASTEDETVETPAEEETDASDES